MINTKKEWNIKKAGDIMLDVVIENSQGKRGCSEALKKLISISVKEALDHEGMNFIDEVDVLLVDNEAIRVLNKEYRDVDKETDVLSFPMYGGMEEIIELKGSKRPILLGDIVISLEKAESQGAEFGHGTEREVSYLTVHSTLHLLGYDHIKEYEKMKMREKEKSIMKRMEIDS